MDYAKINLEVCKGILGLTYSPRVCGYWMDKDNFFVTTDGFKGYIIPKKAIIFNVDRVTKLEKSLINLDDFIHPENEINPTRYYYKREESRSFIRKFTGKIKGVLADEKWDTYINSDFIKLIQREYGIKYYQRFLNGHPDPLQPVLAVQKTVKSIPKPLTSEPEYEYKPVMYLCPMRITFDDDEE